MERASEQRSAGADIEVHAVTSVNRGKVPAVLKDAVSDKTYPNNSPRDLRKGNSKEEFEGTST